MSQTGRPMSDTKQRILDAAERLFAEHGFAATSLRAITASAGVNLAAVNYHFHSKEDLIRALFTRRLAPLNRRRLELLDSLEKTAGSKPVPLKKLVEIFVGPVLETKRDSAQSGGLPVLLGRVYAEPGDLAVQIMKEQIGELAVRFTAAFRRTLPELSPADLGWRLHFTIGALAHTLAASKLLEFLSRGACDPTDIEGAKRRLTAFVVAGLRAPLPRPERPSRRKK